jgi:hypothetical protein
VAGAAALAAAALLWPVSVAVGRGPSGATARCGIDTVIAGHPDHAVEAACRARGGRRAAGAVGAVVIALTGIALYGVGRRDGPEVAS